MGLAAGREVFVAYITEDELTNKYSEFLVSGMSLFCADTSAHIAIPEQLLSEAGIVANSEVQICCVSGAIIIAQIDTLTLSELQGVVDGITAAGKLTAQLPYSPAFALEYLNEVIDDAEGGLRDE